MPWWWWLWMAGTVLVCPPLGWGSAILWRRRRARRPRWSHPCPVCNRAGLVYPHGGQHAVTGPPPSMPSPGPPPPSPAAVMTAEVPVRRVTRPELIRRKADLEQILDVLTAHTMDGVCAELGEISYLLDKDWRDLTGQDRTERIDRIMDAELPPLTEALNRLKDS